MSAPSSLILLILLPSLYGGTAPLELQKNVIFVKASIGDSRPLDMVLDSGTIRTTIDEAVARGLKLDRCTRCADPRSRTFSPDGRESGL